MIDPLPAGSWPAPILALWCFSGTLYFSPPSALGCSHPWFGGWGAWQRVCSSAQYQCLASKKILWILYLHNNYCEYCEYWLCLGIISNTAEYCGYCTIITVIRNYCVTACEFGKFSVDRQKEQKIDMRETVPDWLSTHYREPADTLLGITFYSVDRFLKKL